MDVDEEKCSFDVYCFGNIVDCYFLSTYCTALINVHEVAYVICYLSLSCRETMTLITSYSYKLQSCDALLVPLSHCLQMRVRRFNDVLSFRLRYRYMLNCSSGIYPVCILFSFPEHQ